MRVQALGLPLGVAYRMFDKDNHWDCACEACTQLICARGLNGNVPNTHYE